MGYLAVLVLGGIILVVVVVGLVGGAKKLPTGKLPEDAGKAPSQPAADAPTPAKSVIESPAQTERADRHTPPA